MTTHAKMQAFLMATTQVSRVPGRIFNLADICLSLQWDRAICDQIAARLEKDGLLNLLPNDQAILTTAGLRASTES